MPERKKRQAMRPTALVSEFDFSGHDGSSLPPKHLRLDFAFHADLQLSWDMLGFATRLPLLAGRTDFVQCSTGAGGLAFFRSLDIGIIQHRILAALSEGGRIQKASVTARRAIEDQELPEGL